MYLTLLSGRVIRLEKFLITPTIHSGILAGHPIAIAKRLRNRLHRDVAEVCPCHERVIENMLVVDEGGILLPKFRVIANLLSTPVVPDSEGWKSELLACWFTNNINFTPSDMIKAHVNDVVWERYAIDFSSEDI